MTDHTTPDRPIPDDQDQPAAEPTPDEKPSRLARMRSRAGAVSKGTVIGVLAGFIVGSAGGFAVGAVATGSDHGDRGDRGEQHGRPFDGDGDRGGRERGLAPPGEQGP